jgi:hypothetical protein
MAHGRWQMRCSIGAVSAVLAVIGGCRATGTVDEFQPPAGGADGGDGPAESSILLDTSTSDTPEETMSCASETQKAQRAGVDMFMMVDQSSSMATTTTAGQYKWQAVTSALQGFFQDAKSADLGVGIQYFPLLGQPEKDCTGNDQCASTDGCVDYGNGLWMCTRLCENISDCGSNRECAESANPKIRICLDTCDATQYAAPEVEIGPLSDPTQVLNLSVSLDMHGPLTFTPTYPALEGAIEHCNGWQALHPDRKVVVLLATDGMPSECNPIGAVDEKAAIAAISALAASANSATPALRTFVIGVFGPEDLDAGSPQHNLDSIAKAGGTEKALIVDSSGDVTKQFLAALEAIRTTALSCEFEIPKVGVDGGKIDLAKVNVLFTPGQGAAQPLFYVVDESACDPDLGGWHYDVAPANGSPSRIVLCANTCEKVKQDHEGRIDIEMGCDTRVKLPA